MQSPSYRKTDHYLIRINRISWKENISAVGNVTCSQIGYWSGDRMIWSWNLYKWTPAPIRICSRNNIESPSETEVIFCYHLRPIGNRLFIMCGRGGAVTCFGQKMSQYSFKDSSLRSEWQSGTSFYDTKKRYPRKYNSATCTLYKGASAPRHQRQRDVRRTSKQRGRPTRTKRVVGIHLKGDVTKWQGLR